MNEEVLEQLRNNLENNNSFKQLSEGLLFIEVYDGLMVVNWTVANDESIDYNEVDDIVSFAKGYLKAIGEEGLIYTATNAIEV